MTLYAVWEKEPSSSSSSKESKPSSSTTLVEPTGVELNTTNKTMVVNTTDKLVATVKPNNAKDKTVTWSSNKPNVITVDKNGNIKAVGLGEATITVKTSNGKTATAKVTSDVRSITLSVVNKTISKYGTITSTTITANIDSNGYSVPNSLITWSAPDATGYTAPAYISINGKKATLTARDWWGSTSSIPVTVKVNNKEAKTTIYVEPKINISNRSNGITEMKEDEELVTGSKKIASLVENKINDYITNNLDKLFENKTIKNYLDKKVASLVEERIEEYELRKLAEEEKTKELLDEDKEEEFEEADDLDNIERDEQEDVEEDTEEEIEDDEDSEDDLEEDVPVVEDNKQNEEEYEVHPDAVEVEQEDKFDYTNPTELIGKWAEIFKEATCPECSSDLEICNDGEDKVDIICKSCSSKFYVDKNSGKIYKIK